MFVAFTIYYLHILHEIIAWYELNIFHMVHRCIYDPRMAILKVKFVAPVNMTTHTALGGT